METEDKTEWPVRLSFTAYGVSLMVRSNEPRLMPSMVAALPPGWKATKSRPDVVYSIRVRPRSGKRYGKRYALLRDGEEQFQTSRLRILLSDFEGSLQNYIAEMSPNRVFVHAGVVGWRGKAIVIPGRSFSGKTTLVSELIRRGAVYYSDEFAVLDDRGRVHPYARSLSVRRNGSPLPTKVKAASLGAKTGVKPLPVGLVVISRFREGARWRPRRLTAGKGALEMLDQTVPARREPGRVMATIGRVVSETVVIKSPRGEVKEGARLVMKYLEELEEETS